MFRFREALRARALALAEAAAEALPGTVFLVGSFARGDFSEDSDVDLLVVAEFSEPPHRRLLDADIPPGVEVIALTPREALRAVERCYPIARDVAWALCLGTVLGSRRGSWSSPGVANKFLSGARGGSVDALVLPSRVVELLRRAAEEGGVSVEDFLMDVAAARLDPPESARAYAEAALELLQEAEAELARGDLRQASEKVWGAAALAVKAFAYWRDGVRLASHGELWRYAEKVAEELGEWVHDAWAHANAVHVNFYEGWASGEQAAAALNRVRRLVEAVAGRVLGAGSL